MIPLWFSCLFEKLDTILPFSIFKLSFRIVKAVIFLTLEQTNDFSVIQLWTCRNSPPLLCSQRTIQDLFEVEAGSGEKVEEFVVLHQEPSASEAISPRVARPYIQALHSINLDAQPEQEEHQPDEELAVKDSTEDDQEPENQAKEEPTQKEELNAIMEQVL